MKEKADTQTKELQIANAHANPEICNTFVFCQRPINKFELLIKN
jgi:hypothetical protein